MRTKHLVWIGSAALIAAAVGCATGGVEFDDDDDDNSSSGNGGQGGAVNNACGVDCSTVVSPPMCKVARCNEESKQCEIVAGTDGSECDDGLFCTVSDACYGGECVGGGTNNCGDTAGPCDEVTCDEASQSCNKAPKNNGSACTPTQPCQVNGTCNNGVCAGVPNDCFFAPVPNDCHVAKCNPSSGECEPEPGNQGQPCVDQSDLCTVDKTCDSGTCSGGGAKDCSHLTVGCNDGKCDDTSGDCYADPIPDGQPCAGATNDCNQGYCTLGDCLPTAINEAGPCDDGLSCTANTTCNTGVCEGGTSTIDIYFFDDFSDNNAGWTLDTEWAIGPTAVSSGEDYGYPDPALDHTETADNGVAGVVLGGNASEAEHTFYYLTSPIVDTSAATTVFLEYWRHLNSDYSPYMTNVIEVYDGTTWQPVFATDSSGTQDDVWAAYSYDISTHKNAQMQVRFGFDIGSSGVFTVSGWNVDDVMIASGTCNP